MREATKTFWRMGRKKRGFSLFDWLHGYVYIRWAYLYIRIAVGEHKMVKCIAPLARGLLKLHSNTIGQKEQQSRKSQRLSIKGMNRFNLAETYHGKVVPLDAAEQLVALDEEIELIDLEKIIPYKMAKDIILKNPDHIVALECPCRMTRENPCYPLDVCLIIGEPFASLTADHHPERSRWVTSNEALRILREEDKRGHVHHAFFKDAMLGRFYAICNCCSCCCGAMQAYYHGTPMLASSGYIAKVKTDQCTGCGLCAKTCQFKALSMKDEQAFVEYAKCMGCGVCVSQCAQQAITLRRTAEKGEPLEIRNLLEMVDGYK